MATKAELKAFRKVMKEVAVALTATLKASLADISLDGSALQDSIESKKTAPDTITAYMADYGRYVIGGRRPFVRKVPIAALIDWINRKGIVSTNPKLGTNQLAWAIQNAIYKNGINGRDFITPAVDDEFVKLISNMILEALEQEVLAVL